MIAVDQIRPAFLHLFKRESLISVVYPTPAYCGALFGLQCLGRLLCIQCGLAGAIMFKNEKERAFVLVMLMCGFALLWMTVKDAAFAG